MRSKLLLLPLSIGVYFNVYAQKQWDIYSPDNKVKVHLSTQKQGITYSVSVDGNTVVDNSNIGIEAAVFGNEWKIKTSKQKKIAQTITAIVPQKSVLVGDSCSQLDIVFNNGLLLEWRVYNNGSAWRWIDNKIEPHTITSETVEFNFDKNGKTWYPEESGFFSHNERQYHIYGLDSLGKRLASLPALFESKGIKLLLTESSLFHYPGMWLNGGSNGHISAIHPKYAKKEIGNDDRNVDVSEREDYIASVNGRLELPWRVMMIARKDKELLENQLVYALAKPSEGDYSWVKPGKVQWDWWHYNNVYDVPFRAGVNNNTYKYYIDFASKHHIEYVLLDEGWGDTRDLLKESKEINIQELVDYGKARNVGIMLWMSWLTLEKQKDVALDQFQKWGVDGIKVDFMQRDDQKMVEYYEDISLSAAKRHLLVDFHGAYKPTGWLRTFPNVMTSEGVYGNEQSKFSPTITPSHTTTIPFIRMAAGPMDFTPGGMNNVLKGQFAAEPSEPMTPGTRCNQMAMYVLFESPLQMLCDIPTHYIQNPECMEFLSPVPAVWKQSIALDGEVGHYAAMAREALNGDWYIGAMTDWNKRSLDISLSFLPEGKYKMSIWKDGINADRNAKDFVQEVKTVDASSHIKIGMSNGGGYVARITKL